MRHRNEEKQRSSQADCVPKPQRKTSNIHSSVANSVMERKFLWLVGTTIDSMKPETNSFQYARAISTSKTKGYRIVPYSRRLK